MKKETEFFLSKILNLSFDVLTNAVADCLQAILKWLGSYSVQWVFICSFDAAMNLSSQAHSIPLIEGGYLV
ncbi:MAG: hypothetical protein SFT81_00845 [Candidatus Caenarcaniphilales bacterium]|nr:hypothetical protein [Candidatus Caenarcaniphilales bacterium]